MQRLDPLTHPLKKPQQEEQEDMTQITTTVQQSELDRIVVGDRSATALAVEPQYDAPIPSVVEVLEHANAFQDIAVFLAANPALAASARIHAPYVLIPVSTRPDPSGVIIEAARAGTAAGARVEEYATSQDGGVKLHFGPVYVQVYADAAQVCSQVVVGQVPNVRHALTVSLDGTAREVAAVSA